MVLRAVKRKTMCVEKRDLFLVKLGSEVLEQ